MNGMLLWVYLAPPSVGLCASRVALHHAFFMLRVERAYLARLSEGLRVTKDAASVVFLRVRAVVCSLVLLVCMLYGA